MSDTVIIALVSLCGTLVGTFSGIITSTKLTTYRIEQLEKRVDQHNQYGTRIPVIEEKIAEMQDDINELKKG